MMLLITSEDGSKYRIIYEQEQQPPQINVGRRTRLGVLEGTGTASRNMRGPSRYDLMRPCWIYRRMVLISTR